MDKLIIRSPPEIIYFLVIVKDSYKYIFIVDENGVFESVRKQWQVSGLGE